MAENALDLYEKTLDEICTHRSDVISIDVNEDPEQWRKTIMENRHTFYPVYNEGEEDIVGILDTRDYFRLKDGHSKRAFWITLLISLSSWPKIQPPMNCFIR